MYRSLFLWLLLAGCTFAAEKTVRFTIEAGKVARENAPVSVVVMVPMELEKNEVVVTSSDGKVFPGQITRPRLGSKTAATGPGEFAAELHFIVPKLAAGEKATYTATIRAPSQQQQREAPPSFRWVDTSKPKGEGDVYAEQSRELRLGDRPVLRYMYSAIDESSKESREATYKPYHHVYDPTGKRLVTKGPGGLFPHHRGLYFGFNKISYGPDGKQQADVWHCTNGAHQSHVEFVSEEAGPVLGRHVVRINWFGKEPNPFASELRELAAYNTPGGELIEFASIVLNNADDPVKLDGDPQHAGFHFRGSQEIPDKTKEQTYYLRPDGKGEPGKFRNWPDNKQHVNLPWNALSFVLDDQRFTCCYLDRPSNPKESRFSERDYGRFGSYFEYTVTKEKPLAVNYRVWLQSGEMTVEQVQRLDDDFVQPVAGKVD